MLKEHRVNTQIVAKKVNLVLSDGTMKKEIPLFGALEIAEEYGMDLVEVSNPDTTDIPICKIMDYGKMLYAQKKKQKSNRHVQHVKDIKYGININSHDLEVKHKKIEEFLNKRYIVRYVLELKGREKNREEEAMAIIEENLAYFKDMATWKTPNISHGGRKIEIFTVLHAK
jgi:translation initiation factor IF-3